MEMKKHALVSLAFLLASAQLPCWSAVSEPANFEKESDEQQKAVFEMPSIDKGKLVAERIDANQYSGGSGQIDQLSRQILQKEIELLKFNTKYRVESTRVGKFKPWRTFAYSLAGNTISEVGISHVAYARWKYWRRPALATKPFLRKGPICLLIGHSIIVGGVLIESTLDGINDYKLHKRGLDRKGARQQVSVLVKQIDEMQASRDRAIQAADLAAPQLEAIKAESKLLTDVKNCAVNEYCQFAARDAKIKTARNTANLVTFAGATTGGYMGALGNLLAVANRKPRIALPAGVGFVLSGSFIMMTPVATKLASIVAAKSVKKTETKMFTVPPNSISNFDADCTALSASLSNFDDGGIKDRLEIYRKQKAIFDRQAVMAKAEAKANNKEFVEKLISNTIVGGTKIGWGTQLIVAGSAYSNTAPGKVPTLPVKLGKTVYKVPIRPMKTPAQLFSRRVAQGATTFIPGPAVGALDALQSRVRGEMRERKAKANGKAPGQLLAQRLKELEEMETKLK